MAILYVSTVQVADFSDFGQLKDKNGLTEKEFLAHYSDKGYDKPSVTEDILVLGFWALPGGFVRKDETAYQAAARELSEETGLQNVYLEQIYAFTPPSRPQDARHEHRLSRARLRL